MAWPIEWPAAAGELDAILKGYAEQYALRTLRMLTLGRVGGDSVTVLPQTTALNRADAIYLEAPVGAIDSVTVAGLPLDPAAYAVENGNLLVRTDGAGWPVGALAITYQNSYPADALAAKVAGVLALEYYRMLSGAQKCRLSTRVTNVARQGMTMEIEPGLFPNNETGVPEVDHFIKQWNPNGATSRGGVITPDLVPHRTVTWRAP
jgi:hypothetical protein